jgi:hypothetical protein
MKTLHRLLFAASMALLGTSAHATSNVIYVNGIQNTLEGSRQTANRIQTILDASTNHTGTNKKTYAVTAVWNPIGWNGTSDGGDLAQDKKELFLLKTAEEKFHADFQNILAPHNLSRQIDKSSAEKVAAYLADMTPGDNSLETKGKITDANMGVTQKAILKLIAEIERQGSAVVVAHSQGNLLANLAYAKLAATHGNDTYKYIRVVNVANTSAISVNNLNITHAGDAALFSSATAALLADQSLETMPSRGANWTRTTPACANNGACNFTLAQATFGSPTTNIPDQGAVDETLDHSIVETYLSTAIVPMAINQGVTFTAGAERFVDRFEDFVYEATKSLEASQTAGQGNVVGSQYVNGNTWTDAGLTNIDLKNGFTPAYTWEASLKITDGSLDGMSVSFDLKSACTYLYFYIRTDETANYPNSAGTATGLFFDGASMNATKYDGSVSQWSTHMAWAGHYRVSFARTSARNVFWQAYYPSDATLAASGNLDSSGLVQAATAGSSSLPVKYYSRNVVFQGDEKCSISNLAIKTASGGSLF